MLRFSVSDLLSITDGSDDPWDLKINIPSEKFKNLPMEVYEKGNYRFVDDYFTIQSVRQ